MLYRKEGYPEEDELTLTTITKIHSHSVFCVLDEYDKTGLIHISEISPGRIRNIREYVQEGKKVVCKILRVDKEKNHIDLSLRRVNEAQKKTKLEAIKQELKAEKIIESMAEITKIPVKKLYDEITSSLFEHYEMLFMSFEDVVENDVDLKDKGLKKELADPLMVLVKDKIKPKQVTIIGELKVSSFAENGVDIAKAALVKTEKVDEKASVAYSGAGKYRITVTAPDYKQAEKIMDECVKTAKKEMDKNKGSCDFKRL